METVGIIGTGEIGWRMGRLLVSVGHPVVGFDIRPEAQKWAREAGIDIAESIADLANRSDVVITCVTDGAALEKVVAGENGLLSTLARGKTLIDTTSAEPWITQRLALEFVDQGIRFLDAPVSGGVPAAEAGQMNFMVGGERSLLDTWQPLLLRMGTVITHVGDVGSGHTIKAVNMLALASSMLATAEVLAIGRNAGLSLEKLVEALNEGAGGSYSTRAHYPRFIVPGNFASGFTFDLMRKDLSISIGLADRFDVPLFLGRATWELYRAAGNTGLAGQDNTRIVEPILGAEGRDDGGLPEGDLTSRLDLLADMSNTIIAAETVMLGAASGLKPETVIEVVSAGSGDNHVLSKRLPKYLGGKSLDSGATLGEAYRTALEVFPLAFSQRIPAFLTAAAMGLHAAAIGRFGEEADRGKMVDLIAEWTGQFSMVQQRRRMGGEA